MLTMAEIRRATGTSGLTVASLFAGAGGSSLGYRLAGYDVRYASELDRRALGTYSLNMASGTTLDSRDVRTIRGDDIVAAVGRAPDVLDGSPPCQDFSLVGRRNLEGQNATLYYEFVRLVGEIRPRAFCAENVAGFANGASYTRHFLPILCALRGQGYLVEARTLDASWLGVPQARKRIVLIGLRDDEGVHPAEAFPRKRARQTVMRDVLPEVTRLVRPAGEEIRAEQYGWYREQTWPASGPAPTVTACGVANLWASRVWVELQSGELRRLTVDELKVLSGFPADFGIPAKTDVAGVWRMLGNAVPPPMAQAWAEGVRRLLLPEVSPVRVTGCDAAAA